MITFNELAINPEGTELTISVSVKDEEYYELVYLKNIKIVTQDTYIDSGPGDKAIQVWASPDRSFLKTYTITVDARDILASLSDNIFFVWVETKGTPSSETPCGKDSKYTVGVAVNFYPLYQRAFNFVKEIEGTCTIPKEFINHILQLKALQLAIKTGNYVQAAKYWTKFFTKTLDADVTNKCGCYGGLN